MVLVENAVGVALDLGIDRVIRGNEFVRRFEQRAALIFERRVAFAVGVAADRYAVGATAVTLVESAFF